MSGLARVTSIRLTEKERAEIEAALPLTCHGCGFYARFETRSEFIVKAAIERSRRLLQERSTLLEERTTTPGARGQR